MTKCTARKSCQTFAPIWSPRRCCRFLDRNLLRSLNRLPFGLARSCLLNLNAFSGYLFPLTNSFVVRGYLKFIRVRLNWFWQLRFWNSALPVLSYSLYVGLLDDFTGEILLEHSGVHCFARGNSSISFSEEFSDKKVRSTIRFCPHIGLGDIVFVLLALTFDELGLDQYALGLFAWATSDTSDDAQYENWLSLLLICLMTCDYGLCLCEWDIFVLHRRR